MTEQNIIESMEYVDYKPPIDIDLNYIGKTIPISLYNENIKTCPHYSNLIINGKITLKKNSDGSIMANIDTEKINFVNILHEFSEMRYYIGGNEVDSVANPGISVAMKGLTSFEDDKLYNDAGWRVTSNANNNILNEKGYFSICIPLKIIFGFCEDYTNYIYRIHQELQIMRSTNGNCNNTLVMDKDVAKDYTVSLSLSEIIWRIPQYKFSLELEQKINNEILTDTEYEMFYRHWMYLSKSYITGKTFTWDIPTSYYKPRYVILGFQKNRDDKITTDNGNFDLCNLENVQVTLNNNIRYPNNRLNVNVSENKCTQIYNMYKEFKRSYYGQEGKPLVDYYDFINKYPIVVIDCSKQSEIIKGSTINIKIEFQWWDSFSIDSVIHCLVITSDRARYNPLKNMVVVH
ncbi:unnamed protein product [Brugia timori]|uniref:L27 domain-containing protein n=1 Tax=Brugia timori TaxID=42155 RepID=A0A0R3Q7R5_9BILA|nr:unnamed protein product [Brugia timori]